MALSMATKTKNSSVALNPYVAGGAGRGHCRTQALVRIVSLCMLLTQPAANSKLICERHVRNGWRRNEKSNEVI